MDFCAFKINLLNKLNLLKKSASNLEMHPPFKQTKERKKNQFKRGISLLLGKKRTYLDDEIIMPTSKVLKFSSCEN